MTLCLWMAPAEPEAARFRRQIADLAAAHSAPTFVPHVTVLGFLETDEAATAAALSSVAALLPLEVEFDAIVCDDDNPWRSLYLRAVPTPQLMRTRELAEELLGARDEPPFSPHLSLMYSGLPTPERERIAAALPLGELYRATLSRVEMWRTPPHVADVAAWEPLLRSDQL